MEPNFSSTGKLQPTGKCKVMDTKLHQHGTFFRAVVTINDELGVLWQVVGNETADSMKPVWMPVPFNALYVLEAKIPGRIGYETASIVANSYNEACDKFFEMRAFRFVTRDVVEFSLFNVYRADK